MSYKYVNQAEQIARNEMEVATARVLDQMGFTHGTTNTVDLLSDVAVRYIRKMCQTIRSVSDHGGRTGASLGDVEYAYRRMFVDVDEMNDYLTQNLPLPPRLIPRFPVALPRKENKVAHIAPTEDMPEHFPSWAPPLYSPGMTTVASNSNTSVRGSVEAFPDFSSFSATSLGLNRNRQKPQPVFHKSLSRPASSASLYQALSRTASRSDLLHDLQPASVDSRPSSSCSNTSGLMFKRRKRKFDNTPQATVPPVPGKIGVPSSSGLRQLPPNPVLPKVPEEKPLFLAKDLAMDHRPVMNATHSGRNAAPADTATEGSRFDVDQLQVELEKMWEPGAVSPVEVVQFAIMRNLFISENTLSEELKKAFAFINTPEQPLLPPPPPPVVVAPPQPIETPTSYRIVPAEPALTPKIPVTWEIREERNRLFRVLCCRRLRSKSVGTASVGSCRLPSVWVWLRSLIRVAVREWAVQRPSVTNTRKRRSIRRRSVASLKSATSCSLHRRAACV